MKRILTTVVALAAVLSIGTVANAALYTYDVSGAGGSVHTVSSFAATPCAGGLPANCFVNPLSAGSSLNVDITGYAATLQSSAIEIDTVTVLFGVVTITTDVSATMSGATGTLVGDDILWSSNADYIVAPTSTLTCTDLGPGLGVDCATLGLTNGGVYPISILNVLGNTTSLTSINLGTWDLSGDLASILGSSFAVTGVSNVAPNPPAGWLQFGANGLGFPVPEPGSMALVLLGLGGLALRARKA